MSSLNIIRMFITTVCVYSLLIAPSSAQQALSGNEIERLITSKTVRLSTPFGVALPLFYAKNGEVTGDVSGISAASLFAPKEKGKWWIKDNSMCQQWPTWYNGRQFCFNIKKLTENKIQWLRDDGATGTATIAG